MTTKYPRIVLLIIQALRRRRTARLANPQDQIDLERQQLAARQAAARAALGDRHLLHPSRSLRRLTRPYLGAGGGLFNQWNRYPK